MKILIVRFSSIGDIVLTTPVIRCLKQQTPAVIHYLTFARYGEILEHHPGIDRLITVEKRLDEVLPVLRKERYDLIVDLHNNLRTMVLKLRLRRPVAVVSKLNIRKYLLVRLGVNLMPDKHIADRYLATVARLGVVNDHHGLDYFPDPEVVQRAGTLLPLQFREGYATFVTGGRYGTKIYPAERASEVIRRLNLPVVLLGGPEDRERGEAILSGAADRLVFNGCGVFSLHESAVIVGSSRFVITNDTGLMHIAAAYNRKIISLWGNTVPELGMYPYMPAMPETHSTILEIKGLSCRPCSKIGFQDCPKKHFRCMRDISPEHVADAAERMM